MIVSFRLGLWEFGWDFDTAAPAHDLTTAQTQAPNGPLLRRFRLQMNHYCADLGFKWITTAQTQASN